MNTFYIRAILTASIGGILYGYDMGVISGALPLLSSYFQLTPSQEEWVVSLLYFGGGVGAASGGFLCDWFGRKLAILITDVMFGVGAIMLFSAQNVHSVYVGRCVVGWAAAVSGIADVVYLHEISSVWDEGGEAVCENNETRVDQAPTPDRLDAVVSTNGDEEEHNKHESESGGRGSVVSVNEACISLGFLLAYGVAFSMGDQIVIDTGEASNAWRLMFAFGGLLAACQFFGMLFMPESPVWLQEKGRINEAVRAKNKIKGEANNDRLRIRRASSDAENQNSNQSESNVGIEMTGTSASSANSESSSVSDQSSSSFAIEEPPPKTQHHQRYAERLILLWIKIRSAPSQLKEKYHQSTEMLVLHKRQFAISFFLAASQQFCGHPSVLSYSTEIFAMLNAENGVMDAEEFNPVELTVGIGVLKFLTTCIVILCIEKAGRRLWLLSGMTCILLSLTFLCIAFIGCDIDIDGHVNAEQHHSSPLKNDLGIIGIYGVAIGYAASYGPLTWLITSELFPSSIRGRALGFATIITYIAAGLVSRTFLSLQKGIGLSGCFALYWIATAVSIVFVWLGVPDTGGEKSPEEIENEMKEMWMWGGRRQSSRCPVFWKKRPRNGERSTASHASWAPLGGYGSWGRSSDANLESDDAAASSASIPQPPADHSGLTPRKMSSSNKIV